MALLKLKATKPFRYASRALAVGDQFEASSRDARVLTAIRKAEYVRAEGKVAAPPARVVARAKAATAAEPAKPKEPTTSAAPPSLPDPEAAARQEAAAEELKTARTEYEAAMGKRPGPQWDVATIRQRMADAADAKSDEDGDKDQ